MAGSFLLRSQLLIGLSSSRHLHPLTLFYSLHSKKNTKDILLLICLAVYCPFSPLQVSQGQGLLFLTTRVSCLKKRLAQSKPFSKDLLNELLTKRASRDKG